MRRILLIALACSSLAFSAARGGGHGGTAAHAGSFHGGGSRGGGGVHTGGGFRNGGFNHRPGFRAGFGFQRFPRVYPYFWSPYFYSGYGYYDPYWYSSAPDYSDSGYGADYGYPAPQPPPVIVNQDYPTQPAPPAMVQEYTAPGPPAPSANHQKYDTPLYLLAFHGGEIRAVLAYWVDGASLHYVTMEHAQKQVALASVDRALSERLNTERNVTFQLPR
ncbi:MAG TPA: hypothetical protein VKT81_22300 [Bryobacteraceae bacterium]|nr:hypothetical protein [Bryobacteraceae bacterium]